MLQYYTYRLAIRKDLNPIDHSKKLFQQYLVDAYVKVESQIAAIVYGATISVEKYQGLMDQNNAANDMNLPPGEVVVLSSTFQGSPCSLLQNYQDAMAMIAKLGKPDLFLTFTCNPK